MTTKDKLMRVKKMRVVRYIMFCQWRQFMSHQPYSLDLATCEFSPSPKLKKMFYLVVITCPDRHLSQSSVGQCIRGLPFQRIVSHFWNRFRDWNYIFQTLKKLLMGFNVHFSILVESVLGILYKCTLHIEQHANDRGSIDGRYRPTSLKYTCRLRQGSK